MKRREGGKRDHRNRVRPHSFSIDDALCAAHLRRVWVSEPPPHQRPRKIHHLVLVSVPADRRGDRLGDVSFLAIKERNFAVQLTEILRGCYCQRTSRGSSVVEQPIRNRQVESSTLSLGSRIL